MVSRTKTIFVIRGKRNFGGRIDLSKEFNTRRKAKAFLKRVNAPGKVRTLPSGKKIRLTSFRQSAFGQGINNPRIIKRRVFR